MTIRRPLISHCVTASFEGEAEILRVAQNDNEGRLGMTMREAYNKE